MASFRYFSALAAFSDASLSSNPRKGNYDWSKTRVLTVDGPGGDSPTLAPGETRTLFSGTRALTHNGSSNFTLALSILAANRYRLTWAGAGTPPAFRTDRALTNNTQTIAIALNGNSTVTFTGPSGAFTGVVAGDIVLIPGPTTGDAATPFNANNEGYWLVLTASSTALQAKRFTGTAFTAQAQSVLVTANSQFKAFGASGTQIGDTLTLSAGFSVGSQKSYTIIAVTPTWVEFLDNTGLPATETAIPGISGLSVYSMSKRYVYVEFDQECVIQVNGDTTTLNRLSPWGAGDPEQTGWFERVGPCQALTVVNLSQSDLKLFYFWAE